MEDIRKMILFLIMNISAFLCYLLGKENRRKRENEHEEVKYLKAKLTADTEEDCLYNTFWIYLAGISELLLIVMLQGELNYISIPCLIAAGIVLGVCAYRVGQNSKEKDK